MYGEKSLRELHLELSERCNAACPMCGRAGKALAGHEIRLEAFTRLVPEKMLRKLKTLRLCGNFGDPGLARDVLLICAHARAVSPTVRIRMNTNGAMRRPAWWAELAASFRAPGSYVQFALDGLEDTHALYRRGTDYRTILANAAAFIAAGGRAHWAFLVFRHNEHQVEEALSEARRLGFERFVLKRTKRFQSARTGETSDGFPVRNPDGSVAYTLQPPSEARLRNDAPAHAPENALACRALDRRSAYVDATGLAWPCCWLAADASGEAKGLLAAGAGAARAGEPVRAQIEDALFQAELPARWATGGVATCERLCGKGRARFDAQFEEFPLKEPPCADASSS